MYKKCICSPLQTTAVVSKNTKILQQFMRNLSTTKLYIDGKFVESKTSDWIDLHNPATNEVVTRVPKSTPAEMEAAVASAKKAYETWSKTSIISRQQVLFRLQNIIKSNMKKLAENITEEQGKTLADAEGDVLRGLQVVEQCCSIPTIMQGESLAGKMGDRADNSSVIIYV
uniref:Probable methylmalonate-semialdehyde/malonate-semialdehyde dehydrogenase [acylating], mitochondrial n=1 Tax=Cacopsylla melanoneura TaxID=428564 RepID=A0A8D8VVV8_9HEMI